MKKHGRLGRLFFGFIGLLAMSALAACSGGGDGGSAQPGVVSVSLTDAPACGYDAVWVTVSKVRIHQSDSANENAAGWTDITLNPPRKINLLNLNDPTQPNFALDNLGEASLPAGHYTQVRLVLAPNPNGNGQPLANSVVVAGNEIELETPSGIQSGVKLVHQFDVASGQRVDLLLDFDACKSIVQTGNGTYKLKPVIKVIPYVLNGIDGFIDTNLFADQTISNNINNVVVTAQVDGEIVRATMPNSNSTPNPNRGKFFLARLTPGINYDVVITANGRATKIIAGVPVPTSTSITTISTVGNPFALSNSGTQSISGTVTLNPADDDGTVIVAAKQTLNGARIVTVKEQVASVLVSPVQTPGDYGYAFTQLPVADPSLSSYPATQTFTDQPVGGIYTIHASAQAPTTTYNTQAPSPLSVNIVGGNRTNQNLTLTP